MPPKDNSPDDSWFDWNRDDDFDDDEPEFGSESEFNLSDDLRDAERQIRIQHLREEIEKRGGSWETLTEGKELTPETEEALLSRVLYFETAPRTTYAKILIGDGIELPPPDSFENPEKLRTKLWDVIHGLAHHRVFLQCTDHLSDADFYSLLWFDKLNSLTIDISSEPEATCHLDLLGSGSVEETKLWLKFYADDEERLWWNDTLGDGTVTDLPEKEKPAYDRDRHLPRPDEY
jgi:hypothetical protein